MDRREKILHGDESLPVALYHITPNHLRYHMNVHWHPEHEVLFVEKGVFRLRMNETLYVLREGDVAFIQGGVLHSGEPENCRYTCVVVNLAMLMKKSDQCTDFAERLHIGAVKITPLLSHEHEVFSQLCAQMSGLDSKKNNGYAFLIKGLIFSFFGEILSRGLYTEGARGHAASDAMFGRMKDVILYMENNYGNNVLLSDLAKVADMTPNHLCRCFKSVMGITPLAYLISYRLAKARYALVATDRSVTDISLDCGFNDISYFIQMFKKAHGMTPKQYRKNHPQLSEL